MFGLNSLNTQYWAWFCTTRPVWHTYKNVVFFLHWCQSFVVESDWFSEWEESAEGVGWFDGGCRSWLSLFTCEAPLFVLFLLGFRSRLFFSWNPAGKVRSLRVSDDSSIYARFSPKKSSSLQPAAFAVGKGGLTAWADGGKSSGHSERSSVLISGMYSWPCSSTNRIAFLTESLSSSWFVFMSVSVVNSLPILPSARHGWSLWSAVKDEHSETTSEPESKVDSHPDRDRSFLNHGTCWAQFRGGASCREGEWASQQLGNWLALHSGFSPPMSHQWNQSRSNNTDPQSCTGHRCSLQRRMTLQLAHWAGEAGPSVWQVPIFRSILLAPSIPQCTGLHGGCVDAHCVSSVAVAGGRGHWTPKDWGCGSPWTYSGCSGSSLWRGPLAPPSEKHNETKDEGLQKVICNMPSTFRPFYLSASLFGQHPQPVSNHSEDRGEISKTKNNP